MTPWTVAHQAPLSMGILQVRILQLVAMPPPGDLSGPGIEPRSPASQADSLPSEPPGKPLVYMVWQLNIQDILSSDVSIPFAEETTIFQIHIFPFLTAPNMLPIMFILIISKGPVAMNGCYPLSYDE